MDIYVKIDGGIGRVIAATGAVEQFAINKALEGIKVNVISTYPQLFNGIEAINRVYHISMPYLYEDYISKGEFIEPEPYNHYLYYRDEQHLATVFNFLLNGKREFVQPKITLTENEIAEAKQAIADLRKQIGGKKIMVVQPWGSQGGIPLPDGTARADESYRSLSSGFYNRFVENYKNEYHILSVQAFVDINGQRVNQLVVKDTQPTANDDVRKVIAILPHVDLIVAVDSFVHHASASLGTPVKTIVLWGGTNDKNLGYSEQTNYRTGKAVIYEPNRVPHDHALYVNKNKGCTDFNLDEIKKFIDEPNGNPKAE